jgi:hypothetical protein
VHLTEIEVIELALTDVIEGGTIQGAEVYRLVSH